MSQYDRIVEALMKLVDAINTAETIEDHEENYAKRIGFIRAVEAFYGEESNSVLGYLLMSCDNIQIVRGETRPMCGGLFLDWKARKSRKVEKE